jgi:hypothetical protein
LFLSKFALRSTTVIALFFSSQIHAQSDPNDEAKRDAEIESAARSAGICQNVARLDPARLHGDHIGPGKYLFYSAPHASFDFELVGGGGSGGGTTLGTNFLKWGAGGRQGEIKRWPGLKLEIGVYLLEVGKGGHPVTGSKNWRNYEKKRVNGSAGGRTRVTRCASEFTVIRVAGGAGGQGDGFTISTNRERQRAGTGANLVDTENGKTLGTGGAGGAWKVSGTNGKGWGSGGGGQGGRERQGIMSGRGADGYARIFELRY